MKPKWQKGLKKSEIRHLKEWAGVSLESVKRNFLAQAKMRAKSDAPFNEPCFTCKAIARKMDLL